LVVHAVELAAIFLGEHVVLLQSFADNALEVERSGTFRRYDRVVREHGPADRERESVTARDIGVKARGCGLESITWRHRRTRLVLDPDRALVHREQTGVVRGVVLAHELGDAAIRTDDVMRGQDARWNRRIAPSNMTTVQWSTMSSTEFPSRPTV
jgi:hypothetical protein